MPGQPDDIILNKAAIIKRCIERMLEEYQANPSLDNYTHIDAIILNIERACQAAIDIAMHLTSRDKLGMPQSSADAFRILSDKKIISVDIAKEMISMVAYRNIAIHEYQNVEMEIVRAIVTKHYKSFERFLKEIGVNIV